MHKPARKPVHVLIIDDSPQQHELYNAYLSGDQTSDYHLLNAYSGEEGEKLYQENHVDCVLVDYRLPDIDGLEVLKRLTHTHHTVPAVMLTGEGNETIAVTAMKNGSQDYLPKRVVTPQALKRTIERAMERAHLTHRMENYRLELERSNEDLERFANVVAHDLKSPLRAVTQHLQLIREANENLDEKSLKSMMFAINGAQRMRRLIEAVFEFSKAGFEKRVFTEVDCNLVLEGVKSNLASHMEERNALITHDTLPTVIGDSVQLMQVLQNLVGNALKFCEHAPHIHISGKRSGQHWVIGVRDNGIGIPKAAQSHIFTIFKRLHDEKKYEGCGVGLAICERVIRNHGGVIKCESEPGKGSVFTFTLPVNERMQKERME